ncbi:DUF1778 domain-containing protein [Thiomicrorhabdus sp. Milos-T2]|uniref:type II toxin-antitoxin system TacA family antitoxin n=1 Tax=Thiomicrorhabdus sp. Milos-T2 TaxID=90814 RepID=UPI000494BCA7|nr:DUF1778 domain-containing protein [Thiomicrorhabdus sp. Milos-T2]
MARTAQINMRVEPEQQAIISRAAQLQHMDRTTFIVNAAYEKAKNVLLDQTFFQLDEKEFTDFNQALNMPVRKNNRLKELFKEKSPWEK